MKNSTRSTSILVALGLAITTAVVAVTSGLSTAAPAAGSVTEVQVTGRGGVAANASAVVVNLTSADPTQGGYVTAWPCGESRPNTSNLNYRPGAATANNAIVKVGTGGKICLYTDKTTQLIADVNGYFPTGSDYQALSPARILDTRTNTTPTARSVTEVQVTGRGGVAANASAVVVNLTSADPTQGGYVTAWPCGESRPNTSNLNYRPGAATANNAIVKVGTGGKICLYTDKTTQLIADVNGYFPTGSDYQALSPARILDTRTNTTPTARSVTEVQVTGRGGVAANASAVVVNLTSADPTQGGYVTAWPCGESRPNTSNLNYRPGAATANNAIVKVGTGGKICLYTDKTTQLIADVNGYFPTGSDYQALSPARILDTRTSSTPAAGAAPAGSGGAAFLETFDNDAGLDRFRTGVFYRERDAYGQPTWVSSSSWFGDHDTSCGGPTTRRTLAARNAAGQFDDSKMLYTCKNHMMTSMGDVSGYSIVWFSPNQTFSKVSEVCFDVNLTSSLLGGRQWWEVAVVPVGSTEIFADLAIAGTANVMNYGEVGATVLSFTESPAYLKLSVGNDLVGTGFPSIDTYRSDIATRVQHCMKDLGNGQLQVSTFNQDGSPYTFTANGSFPSGQVKVVFKDHNYTPNKGCPNGTCGSYSWHWDNIIVRN